MKHLFKRLWIIRFFFLSETGPWYIKGWRPLLYMKHLVKLLWMISFFFNLFRDQGLFQTYAHEQKCSQFPLHSEMTRLTGNHPIDTQYNQKWCERFKTVEKIVPGNHNLHKAGLKKQQQKKQFPVADHIMLSDVNTWS